MPLRTRSFRTCHATLNSCLRVFWICAILWFELGIFHNSVRSCRWPDDALSLHGEAPAHVLIVADPQILDLQSYPDRHPLLQYLSQWVVDLNLRKSWHAARRLSPDVVVFLGDMMDRGRADMSGAEYEEYYQRFKSIFHKQSQAPVYYLPGNHDVGLGSSSRFSISAVDRYKQHFGPLSQSFVLANHTVVLVDGPGLVDEDETRLRAQVPLETWRPLTGKAFEFLKHNFDGGSIAPTILFTHIPLARPDSSPCGPLRERGSIRAGTGLGYQNTLGPALSAWLLAAVRPAAIFSGDDHDYCAHTHATPEGAVREVTVKSFSMAMGIRRPGFQLLSLAGGAAPTHADAPCLLPDQIGVYTGVYAPLGVLSLALLLIARLRRPHLSSPRDEPFELGRRARDRSVSPRELLPAPGGRQGHGSRRRKWPWLAALEVGLESPTGGARQSNRRSTFVGTFASDVRDVAWPPVLLFAALSWWAFRWG